MNEPSSLSALLAWYREEVDAAIPQRIHSRDTADDGAPEWHGAFRTWLTAHPAAEDRDGQLLRPLLYWVWRMPTQRQWFLKRLIAVDFDWRWAARLSLIGCDDAAHDFARESLRRLYRSMYTNGQPNEPHRPKLGDCAEPGCPNRTTRLRCPEHLTANIESA